MQCILNCVPCVYGVSEEREKMICDWTIRKRKRLERETGEKNEELLEGAYFMQCCMGIFHSSIIQILHCIGTILIFEPFYLLDK